MDKWEYCEVYNQMGTVYIRRLVAEGNGWVEQTVARKDVHNMAMVLSLVGKQGWELVAIDPPTTDALKYSRALLKRRIEEPPATGDQGQTRPAEPQ